ncbi:hypothetical protein PR202_gn00054 [Eleusine coracana subsp. coracana]|uniref:Uncharacterized protein n=1 Tax=Eleusine coracana subsp. coracana TaxID=191504 RepID=A0AAV5F7L5_ELECO|nr:hypothetical protein PR202_gb20070 [Eleusine coracana subsp. coracana]GJN40756.1 hypothetical protein PR202_gn00054 [Eleusine coracana subsp. coracana]
MAHDLRDDLELVAADYDYFDQDFGFDDESPPTAGLQNEQMDDTSASDYKEGKDMQGMPWERLNYSRDQYRDMRLRQYKNYQSLTRSCSGLEQLRDLLWATSKNDVYMLQNYSVMHWSPLLQRGKEVLNVGGQLAPTEEVRGARPLSRVQISTMAVKDNLMVAGGFQGELVCKYVDKPGVAFCTNLTGNNNSITNSVDIYESANGATRVMAANNDCVVRTFDTERFSLLGQFTFPWSVNVSAHYYVRAQTQMMCCSMVFSVIITYTHYTNNTALAIAMQNTSASPDGKLVAVLGDSSDCLLADSQSGKEVATLRGHVDYSFSSAWHPGGHVIATGNQDATCRLWDARNTSRSFAVLKGRIGAVRGLRFSADGRFLAAAEAADFVHVYDAEAAYAAEQEVDLFGEIAGAAFSPDGEAMFVAVADRTYGGLLEFRRRRAFDYLDAYFF